MGPLQGIKVLDLTSMVSGPVAAMMLGDQGADVIKVEPTHGEQLRYLGEKHNDITPTFYSCNRNKKSLAIDLKSDAGKEVLWKLIDDADVLLQNFRPGAIERMGFSEEVVRKRNAGIIFVSISGFGEEGPYAHKRVYDPIIQGLSGAADIQANRETGRPGMFRIIIADKISALTAAQAISSALFHRERKGEGQHIKLSMLDATVAFFWPEGMSGLTFAEKEADHKKSFSSIDLIYESSDGYITMSTVSDKEWAGFCTAVGRPELVNDERFATARARRQNIVARREIAGAEIVKRPTQELLQILDAQDVPCAPILSRQELLDHPQIEESGTVSRQQVEGFGEVRQAIPAARFQLTESTLRLPAPKLGQHSLEILAELGFGERESKELIDANIVRQAE
ncbi:MAG TPA: CoA transferase [Gammaproteobacteria bacterium]|uniref:CoA transferase n=1 Tax=OM182 bacterium TaxID=2510334 RepID=A0A520S3Y8_9GAMM|nr:MAG: CoA transferase [Gammaproteobacteria bacterium TMED163]RZO77149.1 MAG: CoA transferase [OM182 bacterium]HAR90906.1 CoA transferase [Gammaproteobacteria bacterium]HBJ90722.1 CoA transferase [Gammaproteobacteria bacterium]HBP98968.1 CoA transferase [Gammaproteobacteria bacterium]|tara:strand:- start:1657 stop:2844 length:1188 start_codon:yes stop_codon:yes gene_type:complete